MSVLLSMLLFALVLAGCEVPTPPPELPTATPGSSNPESPNFQAGHTPVRIEPNKGYTPIAGAPGSIFFVRSSGVWRISPDGSGERQLASLPVTNPPQPSPDGSLVAFTTADGLYVVASTGGEPRKLAGGTIADRQRLGWTPDGKMVGYFTFDAATMGREIAWAVPVEGGDPVSIHEVTGSAVSRGAAYEKSVRWSPDGLFVAVSGVDNPFWLLRWPLSTGREGDIRQVPGGEPEWSPDSRSIVYAETVSGALLVYGVLEAEATPFRNELRLIGTGLGEYSQGPGPRFSPASTGSDSDLIAFRSRTQQGEPQVAFRRRSVGELEPLPPFTNNPAWSPGGDRVVVETGYLKAAPLGPQWTPNGLSIARLSLVDNQPHQMFPLVKDAMWPAWSK
ncbi:MAG TPA: hypothetical protein VGE04_10015 [Chloroflexia bacterium]